MSNTYTKYPADRCPRCGGFLYGAIYTVGHKEHHIMKDKVICANCGRYWRFEGGIMVMWPERNGDAIMEAIESLSAKVYKRKKTSL